MWGSITAYGVSGDTLVDVVGMPLVGVGNAPTLAVEENLPRRFVPVYFFADVPTLRISPGLHDSFRDRHISARFGAHLRNVCGQSVVIPEC